MTEAGACGTEAQRLEDAPSATGGRDDRRTRATLAAMRLLVLAVSVALGSALPACREPAKETPPPAPEPAPPPAALHLGAPIEGAAKEAPLAAVAAAPARYGDAPVITSGTIEAVCQHKGCWMELRDEGGEAHVKMAGHSFFVPRSAKGKRARVMGRIRGAEPEGASCGGAHGGGGSCRGEAEAALGRPLAKLELVASGVEIYD